jgi:hypothetical protein
VDEDHAEEAHLGVYADAVASNHAPHAPPPGGHRAHANGSSLALVYTYRRGQPGHVLKAAAARRGLSLAFQRTTANLLRFKVAPLLAAAAEEALEADAEAEPASDAP